MDHSSVFHAVRKSMSMAPFARVELASSSQEFEVDGELIRHSCRFEWVKRKEKPFAVIDSITDTTKWFDTHAAAQRLYLLLCDILKARADRLGTAKQMRDAGPDVASAVAR